VFSSPHNAGYIRKQKYENDFKNFLEGYGLSAFSYSIEDICRAENAVLVEGGNSLSSCFITGISPLDPTSKFTANITMENGMPKVTPVPDLGEARKYTIYGKTDLGNPAASWTDMSSVPEEEKPEYRFFKVGVSLP
jgi:hypothetical protein